LARIGGKLLKKNVPLRHILEVDGRRLQLSNLEKVLYPEAGFTKGQVIDYYVRIARTILPYLKDRPITLKRYPNGVMAKHFYEKDKPRYTPPWVATFPVPRRAGGADIRYIMINDLPTLVWCANLANLELHPFLHRAPAIDQPTAMVFDLDPGENADILDCGRVAFFLKDLFAQWKLALFPKVSGSRGIQVYVPLNTKVTYEVVRPLAKSIAEHLEREHPDLVIAEMAKVSRAGKVFIDWSQNSDFKTTVSVYSLRAKRPFPFVSMPVAWEELDRALSKKDRRSLDFSPGAALERIETLGDLFAPVLKLKQRLPADLLKRFSIGNIVC
jgi:bifunctional non-homologous end joining protein LigD